MGKNIKAFYTGTSTHSWKTKKAFFSTAFCVNRCPVLKPTFWNGANHRSVSWRNKYASIEKTKKNDRAPSFVSVFSSFTVTLFTKPVFAKMGTNTKIFHRWWVRGNRIIGHMLLCNWYYRSQMIHLCKTYHIVGHTKLKITHETSQRWLGLMGKFQLCRHLLLMYDWLSSFTDDASVEAYHIIGHILPKLVSWFTDNVIVQNVVISQMMHSCKSYHRAPVTAVWLVWSFTDDRWWIPC